MGCDDVKACRLCSSDMTFQHFRNFEGKYSVGSIWSLIKKVDQLQMFSQKWYCFSLLYTYFHKFMQVDNFNDCLHLWVCDYKLQSARPTKQTDI